MTFSSATTISPPKHLTLIIILSESYATRPVLATNEKQQSERRKKRVDNRQDGLAPVNRDTGLLFIHTAQFSSTEWTSVVERCCTDRNCVSESGCDTRKLCRLRSSSIPSSGLVSSSGENKYCIDFVLFKFSYVLQKEKLEARFKTPSNVPREETDNELDVRKIMEIWF
ncbi:hypothetical protein NPIL_649981 [Nephila pilipes]|uniref:Uncharacterized protein n=1 Tax=Nephila pilipes TaxID=299642 RepID=A0A8X6P1Q9_NEPPI|nr:hypothetical protein NPIL_649981 [Nephila pilipes]